MIWERCIVMTVSFCVSVCTSPELHVRSSTIFVPVTYCRGSVLLWRRCDTVCTSGFMDDAMCAHNGQVYATQY